MSDDHDDKGWRKSFAIAEVSLDSGQRPRIGTRLANCLEEQSGVRVQFNCRESIAVQFVSFQLQLGGLVIDFGSVS